MCCFWQRGISLFRKTSHQGQRSGATVIKTGVRTGLAFLDHWLKISLSLPKRKTIVKVMKVMMVVKKGATICSSDPILASFFLSQPTGYSTRIGRQRGATKQQLCIACRTHSGRTPASVPRLHSLGCITEHLLNSCGCGLCKRVDNAFIGYGLARNPML